MSDDSIFSWKTTLALSNLIRRESTSVVNDLADSFNLTQYKSKSWLVKQLVNYCDRYSNNEILILGGWYGSYLIPLVYHYLNPAQIIFTDINPNTIRISQELFDHYGVCHFQVIDATNKNHLDLFESDVVINTSCEHMINIHNIKVNNKKAIYAFQSCNNQNDPGHINCVDNTRQLEQSFPFSHVFFHGKLDLGHKQRFMVIGKR